MRRSEAVESEGAGFSQVLPGLLRTGALGASAGLASSKLDGSECPLMPIFFCL